MKKLKDTDLDKFVHNIRNPLNSITLNAELGKVLIDGQVSPEKIKQVVSTILQQCKNCDDILSELRHKSSNNLVG